MNISLFLKWKKAMHLKKLEEALWLRVVAPLWNIPVSAVKQRIDDVRTEEGFSPLIYEGFDSADNALFYRIDDTTGGDE